MTTRKSFVYLSLIVAAMICCNSVSKDKKTSRPLLAGNWISQTYIDSLDYYGTTLGARNAKCLEIVVSLYADSICLVEGGISTKVFKTRVVNDSSFTAIDFKNEKTTVFNFDKSAKKLIYTDKLSGGKIEFRRIEARYAMQSINGWLTATLLFLNERYFAARYYSVNDDRKFSGEVAFTSYGEVIGLQAYKFYRICYDEACINTSKFDLIYLSDEKGSDPYIYQWKNDTMYFYGVKNIKSINTPDYVPYMEIFRFVKKIQ